MEQGLSFLNRDERVLTILHLLGDETAEILLERLPDQAAASLRSGLKGFADRLPSIARQQRFIEEYDRFFRFAVAAQPPRLKLHTGEEDEPEEQESLPRYEPTGDPLLDLEKMNMYQLAGALGEEQSRTVALLLKAVSPSRAAQLLGLIDEGRREAIVRELSKDPQTPEIVLRKIAATTVNRAVTLPADPPKRDDPVQRLVDVLRATDKSKRRQILRAIEDQDPEKASLVNQSLYLFEDLLTLDDSQVQQVLARVDSSTLSTALFGADPKILDRILSNLSKRAKSTLQEELSFKKNVPGSQVKAARNTVVKAIGEADQELE